MLSRYVNGASNSDGNDNVKHNVKIAGKHGGDEAWLVREEHLSSTANSCHEALK